MSAPFLPELITLLGVQPRLGRVFRSDEAADDVVLLSDSFWRSAYAGDRNVIGQQLAIDGRPHLIVGVMPPTFKWNVGGDYVAGWRPFDEAAQPSFRGWVSAVIRLRPGLTIEQANRNLRDAVAASPEASYSGVPWDLELSPLDSRSRFYGGMSRPLLVLLGAVGCVLLIGCANIANLLLGRGVFRRHELAVRSALGASRARLFVQLLTEGIVLGVAAGVVAAALAWWSVPLIPRLVPSDLPFFVANALSLDGRLLAFGCVVVATTCVLSSVAAALHGSREAAADLRLGGGWFAGSVRSRSLRFVLQGTQIALAFVLVSGTFLLTRNFVGIMTAHLGYEAKGLVAAGITPPPSRYPDRASRDQFFEDLAERVRQIRSVTAVTFGQAPAGGGGTRVMAEAREDVSHPTSGYEVSDDYFRTAGISLVAGRYFDNRDRLGSEPVCLIDASFATILWPGQVSIGKRLRYGPNTPWMTVIGIVSPIRTAHFVRNSADFQVYWPVAQSSFPSRSLLVRADGDTAPVIQAMRLLVKTLDPSLDLEYPRAVTEDYELVFMSPRFYFVLMVVFGVLGLGTAVVGLYASTTYAVSQRTREIGIRLALGADRDRVKRDIIRETLGPAVAGTAVGLLLAFWLGRYASTLLYQLNPRDPWTLVAAVTLLMGATGLGALIPARRASRVDPASTLRAE